MIAMLVMAVLVVFMMIGFGLYLRKAENNGVKTNAKKLFKGSVVASSCFIMVIGAGLLLMNVNKAHAQQAAPATTTTTVAAAASAGETSVTKPMTSATGWGYLGAALAVGLGSIGAGVALGMSSAAAIGAVSENQKIFGLTIVFVGMAEGVAIYGLIIAIMILSRI